MRFLVVTSGRRRPLADALRSAIGAVHPDAEVRELWCDPRLGTVPPSGTVLPHRLDVDGLRWADLVLALGPRRAAWAALPWVLESMAASPPAAGGVAEGPTIVVDDTFDVLGPVDGLLGYGDKLAARARHVDAEMGAWGGFAPGLLVAPEPGQWAGWWKARARAAVTALTEPDTDPWWELPVVAHTIIDPAFCLSALTAGEIEVSDAVAGPALVDFAGLDPTAPWWFAAPGSQPSMYLSDSPGLRALCHSRAERMLAAGWAPEVDEDEPVLAGIAVTDELRAWYRGLLADGLPSPNPLVAGEVAAFVDLLAAPGEADGAGAGRHVDLALERRDDLRRAFPHPRWRDRGSFRRWLWSHGLSEGVTSLLTLPEPPRPPTPVEADAGRRPFGVNLVGYLGADLGLGVAARRLQRAFDAAGIPHAAVSYDRTSSNLRRAATGEVDRPYHFNLMLITPDQLPLFVDDVGEDFLAGHHNIGLWYWESDVLAPQQVQAYDHVDEVWVATDYLRSAFESADRVPVHVVPSPLVFDDPGVTPADRARLGLDDRFTFLFSFDFLSVADRKNPIGLAEAYRRAFPDPAGAAGTRLIVKSINGHIFPGERERLVDAVADRDDIEVWDRLLPAADRLALVAAADCYVSLHRAEGLGLTMAEAMAVGTPVIATGYSGNVDFMDDASALLVPAEVVEVGEGRYYPAHGHWADPDLDAAAAMMRRVHDDPALRERLSAGGRAALEPFSYDAVGARAREVLLGAWRSASARN